MKLQTIGGSWITVRYITAFYIGEYYTKDNVKLLGICCKMVDGENYKILQPEHDVVDQEWLDQVVGIISALKLTHATLSQEQLWNELKKQRKI